MASRTLFDLRTWGLSRDDVLGLQPQLERCRGRALAVAAFVAALPAAAMSIAQGDATWLCLFVVLFFPAWLSCRLLLRLACAALWATKARYARYRAAVLRWRDLGGLAKSGRLPGHWQELGCWALEEELCGLLVARGHPAALTRRSGDGGVDIVACLGGKTAYIQCKQYRDKVGVTVVRELYGVMTRDGVEKGAVAAPGGFTEGARAFAAESGIDLYAADDLAAMA